MNKQTNSAGAFSLVEVVLAIGVAAFCLIAIFGFLPAGLNTNQTSTRQTTANGILSSIVADLRATPATAPPGQSTTSSLFGINFQGSTPTLYFAADGRVVQKAILTRFSTPRSNFPNREEDRQEIVMKKEGPMVEVEQRALPM
jgi:uncharacterized protein (TIGR02598 family)